MEYLWKQMGKKRNSELYFAEIFRKKGETSGILSEIFWKECGYFGKNSKKLKMRARSTFSPKFFQQKKLKIPFFNPGTVYLAHEQTRIFRMERVPIS